MILPKEPFDALGLDTYGVALPPPKESWKPCRAARELFAPAAVILCAIPYYTGSFERQNVSRYAALRDYHAVANRLLDELACRLNASCPGRYVPFADNSPFPEKLLAAKAGLGVIGDNSLLLTRKYGSWVFLGELATDIPFVPTGDGTVHTCQHCGRCAQSCPGQAIGETFHPDRCASAISQKKGELTDSETAILRRSGYAWGCDCCQSVCPWNAQPALSPLADRFQPVFPWVTEESLPRIYPDRAYSWRPMSVLLRNLELLKRRIGDDRMRSITVKGTGSVSVKPDLIVIDMTLECMDPDYENALTNVNDRFSRLDKALQAIGFAKDSLKTTGFHVDTQQKQTDGEWVFAGYSCRYSVRLSFDFDGDRLSETLSAVTDCQVEPTLSIDFTVKDPNAVSEALLTAAAENARQKAEVLCRASGVTLGQLMDIRYNVSDIPLHSPTGICTGGMAAPRKLMNASLVPDDIKASDTAAFVWEIR